MIEFVSAPVTAPVFRTRDPQLDHERLEVYAIALEFHALAVTLVPRRGYRVLRDQLERASLSIVLNIAEGAGRTWSPDKQRFYEIARGSTTESAAILDVLRVRRLATPQAYVQARTLAIRLAQMLSRLCSPPR